MSTDQLFDRVNGQDVLGARANRGHREVVITKPSHFRGLRWLRRAPRAGERGGKPGAGMIAVATGLLFLLGAGLLAVSLAAQYSYLYRQRHQSAVSLVEALALDVGMLIFSLLALGLARSGKPAKVERGLIMVCAAGSAGMNLAAANDASPRSILAYTMPPVFLAIVADRVISVVRRHFLGDEEASAWSGFGRAALYGLRFAVAPPSTVVGARRALLAATPLPELPAAAAPAIEAPPPTAACPDCGLPVPRDRRGFIAPHAGQDGTTCPAWGAADGWRPGPEAVCPLCLTAVATDPGMRIVAHRGPDGVFCCGVQPEAERPDDDERHEDGRPPKAPRPGSKTGRFLDLVRERYGDLAGVDPEKVSRISAELAPEVELDPGSARRELRAAVLAAQDGSAA